MSLLQRDVEGAIPPRATSLRSESFGSAGHCLPRRSAKHKDGPRCIISSAPVSDTESLGANPSEAAISFPICDLRLPIGKTDNKEQTPQRSAVAVCKHFMNDILNKSIVLVLNRNWQAINIRTPQEAFCQMATNVATALEIELGHGPRAVVLRPVTWDES